MLIFKLNLIAKNLNTTHAGIQTEIWIILNITGAGIWNDDCSLAGDSDDDTGVYTQQAIVDDTYNRYTNIYTGVIARCYIPAHCRILLGFQHQAFLPGVVGSSTL